MLDSLKESACERMAGKGASGVRAAEVIGECKYAFVSILLTASQPSFSEAKGSFSLDLKNWCHQLIRHS